MIWAGAAFVCAVALAVFFQREPLARAQGLIAGGSITPGCVIAEAVTLLLLALVLLAVHLSGMLR